MKFGEKDPYNFEKIEPYLKDRKKEIGERKVQYGKIYQKRPRVEGQGPGESSSQ